MTPDQYKTLANNEGAAAAFIEYWARENQTYTRNNHIPKFTAIEQDEVTRFVMPKSQARSLFTDNFETNGPFGRMTHPWYGYTESYKDILDQSTVYRDNPGSLRLKRASQVGLYGYTTMTKSIKLLTPKDIFILMTVTPANHFLRSAMWRMDTGINLMKGQQAILFWKE